jgi:anti-sigma regulatory factor (Ser/Thr protein kinase)
MEMNAAGRVVGALHAAFTMGDASCVGEARRHAAQLAAQAGLDATAAGRLALVVTELGNNLVRHARQGQLLLAASADSATVEVISIDQGPGIADPARCMGDGYSTGGTPGTGLGAVRRLATDFELHSAVPDGTVIVARVRGEQAARPPRQLAFACAGISVAVRGETACGDAWAVAVDGTHATVIVADGLGHGPLAADASQAALAAFSDAPQATPAAVLERVHAQLRGTRGAAVAVLRLDTADGSIRSCGAGNVMGRIVSGVTDRSVLTQHGTAGLQIRRPEESTTTWPPHALLVVHSDGIESRWSAQRLMPVLGRDPTLVAAILMRDHCRGRDDATVVVMRRSD